MLALYQAEWCPASRRVRERLTELGLDWELPPFRPIELAADQALQIAVNHEVPETMSRIVPDKPIDWGTHQVLTSHNFAVGSFLAMHFSGGLNMQIEHHLFPGVHYTHYHAITPIVREACAQFNLPYNESRSLWEAMRKHYRLLRRNSDPLSTAPANTVPVHTAPVNTVPVILGHSST